MAYVHVVFFVQSFQTKIAKLLAHTAGGELLLGLSLTQSGSSHEVQKAKVIQQALELLWRIPCHPIHVSGKIIATSAEVTPNGGLVRDSPQHVLNSGLGIIVICPDVWYICLHLVIFSGKCREIYQSHGCYGYRFIQLKSNNFYQPGRYLCYLTQFFKPKRANLQTFWGMMT